MTWQLLESFTHIFKIHNLFFMTLVHILMAQINIKMFIHTYVQFLYNNQKKMMKSHDFLRLHTFASTCTLWTQLSYNKSQQYSQQFSTHSHRLNESIVHMCLFGRLMNILKIVTCSILKTARTHSELKLKIALESCTCIHSVTFTPHNHGGECMKAGVWLVALVF